MKLKDLFVRKSFPVDQTVDEEMISILETSLSKCPRGDAALRKAGMQAEFAAHLMLHFGHFGTGVTFRVGTKPAHDTVALAKPGSIPIKTSNHGLVRGFMPIDTSLGKADEITREGIGSVNPLFE